MDMHDLKNEMERLVKVMETLRGPDGCPWDKKQDYYSLQPYIIEEAYEVVEALQERDINLLKEELGDLLLQVVFQAQIGKENGDFTLTDVVRSITDKLIRRHPHVFQEAEVNTVSELKKVWQEIKDKEKEEKGQKKKESLLDDVKRSQPALSQAFEVQAKAAEVGFDWDEIDDVFAKVEEEIKEVRDIMKKGDKEKVEEEIGDVLFAAVNLSRFLEVNPELALLKAISKFKDRFRYIEQKVSKKGYILEEMSLEELDSYWEESKTNELKGEKA